MVAACTVTLLGLSPILRSLTKGVTEDSIWAIATWLFIANFLGFDYGSGIERKSAHQSSGTILLADRKQISRIILH